MVGICHMPGTNLMFCMWFVLADNRIHINKFMLKDTYSSLFIRYLMDSLTERKHQVWMLFRLRAVLGNPWVKRTLKMLQFIVRLFKQKVQLLTLAYRPSTPMIFGTEYAKFLPFSPEDPVPLPLCFLKVPVCHPVATSGTAPSHIWVLSKCNELPETRPQCLHTSCKGVWGIGFPVFQLW